MLELLSLPQPLLHTPMAVPVGTPLREMLPPVALMVTSPTSAPALMLSEATLALRPE